MEVKKEGEKEREAGRKGGTRKGMVTPPAIGHALNFIL